MKRMARKAIVISASLLLAFSVQGGTNEWGSLPEDAKAVYKEALACLANGEQSRAEKLLDGSLDRYADSQRLLFMRGVLKRSRFSVGAAHGYFKQTAKLGKGTVPGKAAWQALLTDLDYYDGGRDFGIHLSKLKKVSDLHPDEPLVKWLYAIECRTVRERAEEAAAAYADLLAGWKVGAVMAHHTYANVLAEQLGRNEQALEHRVIALDLQEASWTHQGMANTLYSLERFEQALPHYEKAAQLEPADARHWYQWGKCLFRLKKYGEAYQKYTHALKLDPSNLNYKRRTADCLLPMGKRDEAVKLYEDVVAKDPGNKSARTTLSSLREATTNGTAVVLGSAPASVTSELMEAQKYWLGRDGYERNYPKAVEVFERVYGYNHSKFSGLSASNIAGMYARGGFGLERDRDLALVWYERALEAGNNQAYAGLIRLYLSKPGRSAKDVETAIGYAGQLENVTPEDAPGLAAAADAYAASGNYPKAIELQEKAIAILQQRNLSRMLPSFEKKLERFKQADHR